MSSAMRPASRSSDADRRSVERSERCVPDVHAFQSQNADRRQRDLTATTSAKRSMCAERNPVFHHCAIAKRRSTTTRHSSASATKSRTSSPSSRTGIAPRYYRCAHAFFSAICIAGAVVFLPQSMSPDPRLGIQTSASYCRRST
jgi:hypothetical protein